MSDVISVIRNFNLESEIDTAINSIDYDAVALKAIEIIKDKTESGVDFNNKRFKPYSNYYRDVRKEKGLQTNKVDLFFTGNMMSSITANSGDQSAVIKFLNRNDSGKAFAHIAGVGNLPVRDFFFFNDQDMDELLDIAMNFVDDKL